jgi:hypothetical protein
MARHLRSGQMVLWWKSRNAMRERPFGPEEGLRRYKSGSLKSFPDTEVNRERGMEGRGGHQNPKLAPWTKFKVG